MEEFSSLIQYIWVAAAGVLASILTEIAKESPLIDKDTNQYYRWIVFLIPVGLSFFFTWLLQRVGTIPGGWEMTIIGGTLAAGAASLTYNGLIEVIRRTAGDNSE